MLCKVVADAAEYDTAIADAAALGLRLSCVSNTGLKKGWRLTFLPEECFLKPGESHRPRQPPVNVRDWLRDNI